MVHDFLNKVEVAQGIDSIYTSCEVTSSSRGSKRNPIVFKHLNEIQIDIVPDTEPIGISSKSRFGYFLISCDRYSRIFRLMCIGSRNTKVYINGLEQIISYILELKDKRSKNITHVRTDFSSEYISDTFQKWCGKYYICFTTATSKHQTQNGMVVKHWGTIMKLANTMLLHARLT